MADEIDRANEQAEQGLAAALRFRKPAGPAPTGFCLYCGETVPEAHRWCDTYCRENWEKGQRHGR